MLYSKKREDELLIFWNGILIYKKRYHNGQSTLACKWGYTRDWFE